MMFCRRRFNFYLACGLALTLVWGCKSGPSPHRQLSTLHVYVEAAQEARSSTEPLLISPQSKVQVNVEQAPFLDERFVKSAGVVEALGGFAMRIEFDRQGTWLLEQYSAKNRGRHLAIFSRFSPKLGEALNEGRWLAAPLISHRIADGVLLFTPDATREEADQIVLGLSNIARKLEFDSKWW